ncbi:MAG: hypothetical protein DHS20C01_00730 [marine bacterium B5-7]|nr:MAG: hypothetical protein DHS20C01_00730 [marine bacterium B5-7]
MRAIFGITLLLAVATVNAAEFSSRGNFTSEVRLFTEKPVDPRQHGDNLSLSAEPDWYWSWNKEQDSLVVRPFGRLDQGDPDRTHADLRELLWLHLGNQYEVRTGIGQVFWGVTESRHLVDIINQTDQVENIDGEDKLGQPMIWLSLPRDTGIFDFFVLPGFRQRTFPGVHGRPRTQPRVQTSQATYDNPQGDDHIDLAARWSQYIGPIDIGISYFDGILREPRLIPGTDSKGLPVLVPHYDTGSQLGISLQGVFGAWLYKLEAVYRNYNEIDNYTAAVAGFEYTVSSFLGSRYDLGILAEYLYEDFGDLPVGPFEDDLFVGFRLALNDADSSELLAGVIADVDDGSRVFNIEASRRIGDSLKLGVEARLFSSIPQTDPLYGQRHDDYIEVTLGYYF